MKKASHILLSATLGIFLLHDVSAQCIDSISETRILEKLAALENAYGDVPSTIQCFAPKSPAEKLICQNKKLLAMELLDSKAYVYAVENATKSEVKRKRVQDTAWIKNVRNKCTTDQCLCDALKAHTDDSLGGESPYAK